jgi:predicted outer membrane repeat protein
MESRSLAVAGRAGVLARRCLLLAASTLGGVLAAAALLGLLGGRVTLAHAAPAATSRNYPGSDVCATTLQACVDGATPGDTIVIQPNTYITSVTLSQAVSLTGVSSTTVILQALAGQRVLTITGAAINSSVVISGLTFRGGSVTGGACPLGCGGAILITASASPLLRSLIITNNVAGWQGGGVFAASSSQVRLEAVSVLSNSSGSHGGGVYAIGLVTITSSLFQNNRCTLASCGAAGLLAVGELSVSNTRFISNTSLGSAGAAYSPSPAVFTGGLFQDNRCTESGCSGGALYANESLVMTGTQFLSNVSTYSGGALFAAHTATLRDALFRNNRCTGVGCDGGAVHAESLALTNTQLISNSSLSGGGGALAMTSLSALDSLVQDNRCTGADCTGGGLSGGFTQTLKNTQVLSNTSTGYGGGAHTSWAARLEGSLFLNNRCTQAACRAGGLYAGSGLIFTSTSVVSNSSGSHGAGVYVVGPVTMTGGLFQANNCTQIGCGAGALYAAGTLLVTGTQFISNTSLDGAGAVYAPFAAALTGVLFQANQCTQDVCFGGALFANDTVALTNTQFLSNTSRYFGGGLYADQAASLRDVVFRNNRCTQTGCGGGAVHAQSLALTNTQLISNSSVGSGGGALAMTSLSALDSRLQDNQCTATGCNGGGLYASFGLVLNGTQVLSNTSSGDGGGAYTGGTATLNSGLFQNNQCTQSVCQAGGLYTGGTVTLTGTQFLSNTSHFDGGGIFATGDARLSGGLFQGNQCTQTFCFAGGLLASSAVTITATRFVGNSSQSHGGGLYASGRLTLSGAEFLGNRSAMGGGLNLASGGGLIVNTLFAGNQATSGHGAALSLLTTSPVTLTHNTLVSATLGAGSALYVDGATAWLTNTLVSGYAIGLERLSGSLAEDYTLFAGVAQPYSGTLSTGAHTFTGTAAFVNAAAGNFHLGGASDAIDAGLTTFVLVDFDGQVRPFGAASDIGFDEFYAWLYLPLVGR